MAINFEFTQCLFSVVTLEAMLLEDGRVEQVGDVYLHVLLQQFFLSCTSLLAEPEAVGERATGGTASSRQPLPVASVIMRSSDSARQCAASIALDSAVEATTDLV